mgnify:CR=1 FL=1
MSMASTETTGREVATYGGFADAFGGCATVVLAIVALSGTRPDILIGIATIIFAAALLIQSGTLLSEMSAGAAVPAEGGSGGLSYVLLGGLAGVVLGILALIGVHAVLLASIAVIVFGTCMAFGSSAVYQAFQVRRSFAAGGRAPTEVLINEIAAGSSGLQAMAGLARRVAEQPGVDEAGDVVGLHRPERHAACSGAHLEQRLQPQQPARAVAHDGERQAAFGRDGRQRVGDLVGAGGHGRRIARNPDCRGRHGAVLSKRAAQPSTVAADTRAHKRSSTSADGPVAHSPRQ